MFFFVCVSNVSVCACKKIVNIVVFVDTKYRKKNNKVDDDDNQPSTNTQTTHTHTHTQQRQTIESISQTHNRSNDDQTIVIPFPDDSIY